MHCPRVPQDQVSGITLDQHSFARLHQRIVVPQLEPVGLAVFYPGVSLTQLFLGLVVVGERHYHQPTYFVSSDSFQRHHALYTFEPLLEVRVLVGMQIFYLGSPVGVDPPGFPPYKQIKACDQILSVPDFLEGTLDLIVSADKPRGLGMAPPICRKEAQILSRPAVLLPGFRVVPFYVCPQMLQPFPEETCCSRDLTLIKYVFQNDSSDLVQSLEPVLRVLEAETLDWRV